MTSSIAALTYPTPDRAPGSMYDETHWTNPERDDISHYAASKTIAERAAWDFVRDLAPGLELVVINSGLAFAPPLDRHLSTSLRLVSRFARAPLFAVPNVGYAIADARDTVEMHLLAMIHHDAAGERFICANGFLTFMQIGDLIIKTYPDLDTVLPRWQVRNVTVRLASQFHSVSKTLIADLDHRRYCDNAKAGARLGFSFRDTSAAVVDTVRRLRALDLI